MSNETLFLYITALRELAFRCTFGDHQDDMIHDQLVEHLLDHRIRERLILEKAISSDLMDIWLMSQAALLRQ